MTTYEQEQERSGADIVSQQNILGVVISAQCGSKPIKLC